LKLFKGDCRVVGRRSPMALEASGAATAASPRQTSSSETTVH
jgi:hypothetical protein